MALMLGAEALEGVLGVRDAIDLLEDTLSHEAAGKTFVSSHLDSTFEGGRVRMMFAADYVAGYSVTRTVQTIEGVGARHVVSLSRIADGELLAVLDGALISDLRAGAASGVVARKLSLEGPISVGLVGAGHQARMQLETLASVYRVESASVYSPTAENRERYARQMSSKLGIRVKAADSAAAALRGNPVVVAATSSRSAQPVVRGDWLDSCRLLCAVGSTRVEAVEIDEQCFADSELIVVDTPHAAEEAGDLRQAVKAGAAPASRQVALAQVAQGAIRLPDRGRVTFKSVGTALQDLALAVRYYELLRGRKDLPLAPDLASLKKPASPGARPKAPQVRPAAGGST